MRLKLANFFLFWALVSFGVWSFGFVVRAVAPDSQWGVLPVLPFLLHGMHSDGNALVNIVGFGLAWLWNYDIANDVTKTLYPQFFGFLLNGVLVVACIYWVYRIYQSRRLATQ